MYCLKITDLEVIEVTLVPEVPSLRFLYKYKYCMT